VDRMIVVDILVRLFVDDGRAETVAQAHALFREVFDTVTQGSFDWVEINFSGLTYVSPSFARALCALLLEQLPPLHRKFIQLAVPPALFKGVDIAFLNAAANVPMGRFVALPPVYLAPAA
jgi:hypothetical protein